jgi:hypothetical protein
MYKQIFENYYIIIIIILTLIEPKAMQDICVNTREKPSKEEKTFI